MSLLLPLPNSDWLLYATQPMRRMASSLRRMCVCVCARVHRKTINSAGDSCQLRPTGAWWGLIGGGFVPFALGCECMGIYFIQWRCVRVCIWVVISISIHISSALVIATKSLNCIAQITRYVSSSGAITKQKHVVRVWFFHWTTIWMIHLKD